MLLFEKDCFAVPPPISLSFFTATIAIVLFFFIVPSNFLICWAVYKGPQELLRNTFNCLVVNLAFADLIVGLVVLTISTYVHLLEGLTNHPDLPVLPVGHISYFICCTASTFSLTAMAIDRYIAVAYPVVYKNRKITPRGAVTVSICIWFVSICLPLTVYFQIGFTKYAFVFANTAIIATFLIFFFSYITIYRKLHAQFHMSSQLQSGMNAQGAQRRALEHEKRLAKTFVLILAAYLICYTPSCVIIYILNFCRSCSCITIHWFRDLQYVFIWINSVLNPYLYFWQIPSFREAVSASIPWKRVAVQNQVFPDGQSLGMTESNSLQSRRVTIGRL